VEREELGDASALSLSDAAEAGRWPSSSGGICGIVMAGDVDWDELPVVEDSRLEYVCGERVRGCCCCCCCCCCRL
jgi:hypothetical protein